MARNFCSNCGTAIIGGRFCANCGASLEPGEPTSVPTEIASAATRVPVEITQGKTSYRWAWVAGEGILTFVLWATHVWALAIIATIVFWPLLLWAIIASAVASGVSRGSRRS